MARQCEMDLYRTISTIVIGQPGRAKVAHAVDHREQGEPLFCERVFDPGWHFGEAGPVDYRSLLEPFQPLRQRLGADADQRSLQFAESHAAVGEVTHDQGSPLVTDDVGSASHGTTEMS